MTTTVITSTQGTFMDMSETIVAAILPQNLVKNVAPGDTVEIAFKSVPGQIATGKVDQVVEYTGEGQYEPSGAVPVAADVGTKGFLAVRVLLDDEELAKELPLGGAGTTAIYTEGGQEVVVLNGMSLCGGGAFASNKRTKAKSQVPTNDMNVAMPKSVGARGR